MGTEVKTTFTDLQGLDAKGELKHAFMSSSGCDPSLRAVHDPDSGEDVSRGRRPSSLSSSRLAAQLADARNGFARTSAFVFSSMTCASDLR